MGGCSTRTEATDQLQEAHDAYDQAKAAWEEATMRVLLNARICKPGADIQPADGKDAAHSPIRVDGSGAANNDFKAGEVFGLQGSAWGHTRGC